MRYFTQVVLIVLILCSPIGPANAAPITIQDGDICDVAVDVCQLEAALTTVDPFVTFGISGVGPGQTFGITVVAPIEFKLLAVLTTGPDGSGANIDWPAGSPFVLPGTQYNFMVDGDNFVGLTQWLTIGVFPEDSSALNTYYGGSLPVGAAVVPVPAAAWLFGSALLGLIGICRKRASFKLIGA